MFHLRVPLIVAPMAGGPSSVALVAEASRAGALGSIGAAYMSSKQIENFVAQVRQQTANPILINLFVPQVVPAPSKEQISSALRATQVFRDQLELPIPQVEPPYEEDFDLQFEAVLKTKPEFFSFVFGLLSKEHLESLKKENIRTIGTATTLEEALALQDSGVDAVVLQGYEAGGHRGIFGADSLDLEVSLDRLLEQCRKKLSLPLIAAGGIMNAQDIKKKMSLGAQAVQMGTAFLVCKEAGTSPAYRQALLASNFRDTATTRAFSGRWARGIVNTFMKEIDRYPEAILPFPVQNKFTRDIRNASAQRGSSEMLSLWAGTGTGALWTGEAAELIQQLFPDSERELFDF